MGYRSDVAACITMDRKYKQDVKWEDRPYDKALFKEIVGKMKLIFDGDAGQWLLGKMGWRDGVIMLYIESAKWYDDYPEVKQFTQFWRMLQEVDTAPISGIFVRVGEESDDIVEETFGQDPMYDFCHLTRGVYIEDRYMEGKETDDAQEQAA
jgi:hypothetical protein